MKSHRQFADNILCLVLSFSMHGENKKNKMDYGMMSNCISFKDLLLLAGFAIYRSSFETSYLEIQIFDYFV